MDRKSAGRHHIAQIREALGEQPNAEKRRKGIDAGREYFEKHNHVWMKTKTCYQLKKIALDYK